MNELDFLWLKAEPHDWASFLKSHINKNKTITPTRDRKQSSGQRQNAKKHSWQYWRITHQQLAIRYHQASEQLLPEQAAHLKEMTVSLCHAVFSAYQCITNALLTPVRLTDWHKLGPYAVCIQKNHKILQAKNFRIIVSNSYLAITKDLFVTSE